MNVKPFTFDAALVPMVLDGRKTQSRRLDRKLAPGDLFFVRSSSGATYDGRLFEIVNVWQEAVGEIDIVGIKAEGIRVASDIRLCPSEYSRQMRRSFAVMISKYYPGIWTRNGLVWAHEWRRAC